MFEIFETKLEHRIFIKKNKISSITEPYGKLHYVFIKVFRTGLESEMC